jgi:hypothetical protein
VSRLTVLLCLAVVGCAAAAPRTAPSPGAHRLDGRLAIAASRSQSGETLRWENGTVTYERGGSVRFAISGLDFGASGFEGLVVQGEVYDLDRDRDLAGTYQRVLADLGDAIAPGDALLGNEHGVLLVLRSADGESPVGPAAEGLVVELVE